MEGKMKTTLNELIEVLQMAQNVQEILSELQQIRSNRLFSNDEDLGAERNKWRDSVRERLSKCIERIENMRGEDE